MTDRDPESDERIRLSIGCGWCITGVHDKCLPEIHHSSPGKVWLCGCKVCWPVPVAKKTAVE